MLRRHHVLALFPAIILAACSENPTDASGIRLSAVGARSVQVAEPDPLTMIGPEYYEPLQLNGAVDQNGYVSKDNAPANMGQDRPEHIKYWGGRLILQQRAVAVYYAPSPIYN